MRIHIDNLTFECIIGLLDFERDATQKVIVNLWADYNYTTDNFVNYATVVDIIKDDMISNKYELVETALDNIISIITSKFSQISKLKIEISKPDILTDCQVGVSSFWTQ